MKPRINTVLIPSANYEDLNELVNGQMTNQKRTPGTSNRMVKRKAIPAYIAIFADLMTLLLCFFVLLLSMSELDVVRLKMVAQSMHNAFGVEQPEEQAGAHEAEVGEHRDRKEHAGGE